MEDVTIEVIDPYQQNQDDEKSASDSGSDEDKMNGSDSKSESSNDDEVMIAEKKERVPIDIDHYYPKYMQKVKYDDVDQFTATLAREQENFDEKSDMKISNKFIGEYLPKKPKTYDMGEVKKFAERYFPKKVELDDNSLNSKPVETDDSSKPLQTEEESDDFSSSEKDDKTEKGSESSSDHRTPYQLFMQEMVPILKKKNPGMGINQILALAGEEWIKKKAELNCSKPQIEGNSSKSNGDEEESVRCINLVAPLNQNPIDQSALAEKIQEWTRKKSEPIETCRSDNEKEIPEIKDDKMTVKSAKELYVDFIKMLSDKDIWDSCFVDPYALLADYINTRMFVYVIQKSQAAQIISIIMENDTIKPKLKKEIIGYLTYHGLLDNQDEFLFRTLAEITLKKQPKLFDLLLQFFLTKKINPNFQTNVGTMLHIIASTNHCIFPMGIVLKQLLDYGCSLNILNSRNKTPIEVARSCENKCFANALYRLRDEENMRERKLFPEPLSNLKELALFGISCSAISVAATLLVCWLKK
uniref:Uncharacterized protein n=1 Tax=viral metagenome TaxID=1070528 RepID=A0A6C0C6F2_9ZZZZ